MLVINKRLVYKLYKQYSIINKTTQKQHPKKGILKRSKSLNTVGTLP